jgi:hypothetical protein
MSINSIGELAPELESVGTQLAEELTNCGFCSKPIHNLNEDGDIHEEKGFVHKRCLKAVKIAQKNAEQKLANIRSVEQEAKRKRQLDRQFILACDKAANEFKVWVEPSLKAKHGHCPCCKGKVNTEGRGVMAGFNEDGKPIYAHKSCVRRSVLSDPEFRAWIFWESHGFTLPKAEQEEIMALFSIIYIKAEKQVWLDVKKYAPRPKKVNASSQQVTNKANKGMFVTPVPVIQQLPVAAMTDIPKTFADAFESEDDNNQSSFMEAFNG